MIIWGNASLFTPELSVNVAEFKASTHQVSQRIDCFLEPPFRKSFRLTYPIVKVQFFFGQSKV